MDNIPTFPGFEDSTPQGTEEELVQETLISEEKQSSIQFPLPAPAPSRTVCIACNRRVARIDDVFCSRCSGRGLAEKLRDPLPGQEISEEVKEVHPSSLHAPTFKEELMEGDRPLSRRDVSRLLGVSPTTIGRWERKGYVSPAKRYPYSNQCLYTHEQVNEIKQFMMQNYVAQEARIESQENAPREKGSRPRPTSINRRLERMVARSLNSSAGKLKSLL